jgi:hypothetical protein
LGGEEMLEFVPVRPLRTEDGALAALISSFGKEGAMPVELSDPRKALRNFEVINDAVSLSAAATLGLGAFFKGSGSAKDQGFYLDAMSFTDEYSERPMPDQSIIATRWGVGIRVLLRASEITADVSLNFGLVGAAVELGKARAHYEISGIGIGSDGLVAVLEEMPLLGNFSYETYLKLNGTVGKKLADLLKAQKDQLEPQPVAVALAKPLDPIATARTVYYAMVSIANRRSLHDALSHADPKVDRDMLRTVYTEVAATGDDQQQPSGESQARAEEWLRR